MKIFLLGLLSTVLLSCANDTPIVNPSDYTLTSEEVTKKLADCNSEIHFWEKKLAGSPGSTDAFCRLGGTYAKRFSISGRVEDLYTSDSLYQIALKTEPSRVGAYQAIAGNCMSRHQFKEAEQNIMHALRIGDNKSSSLFSMFDVRMELGNYSGANSVLAKFENKNAFAYLIRQAKLDDHYGHLDEASRKMEIAFNRIKDDPAMFSWTLSNLGDMYGHEGRIKEAYQAYLDVLKKNPGHDFALKGIAWIAFSHDHNTKEAKRIATFLLHQKELPDMHLLLAQIADYEKNPDEKHKQSALFILKASDPKYKNMYAKYLALLAAAKDNPSETISIATQEIENRPTPQSYDLLAWGYYKLGDVDKAIDVAKLYVEGKTYEPEAAFHLGMIYKNVDSKKSHDYLSQANASSFELGPVIASEIREVMR